MPHNTIYLQSGWDKALTSADNIEGFTPTGGSPKAITLQGIGAVYCYAGTLPQYSEGQERFDPNGGSSFSGFKQVIYTQADMHRDTLAWLKTNYRGQVSVNLTQDSSVYSDWNAYLRFTSRAIEGSEWLAVDWIFTLVEEIA